MEKQTIRVHRVGSVTFGMVLIVTGVLFLIHLFFPRLDYRIVCHLWPLVLILLGIEVLLGSRQKSFEIRGENGKLLEENRVVYDGAAIILTIVLTLFSLFMGIVEWEMAYYGWYWY